MKPITEGMTVMPLYNWSCNSRHDQTIFSSTNFSLVPLLFTLQTLFFTSFAFSLFLVCSVFFILSLLLPLGIKKKKKQLKINLKNYPHPVPLLPLTTPSQLPLPLLSTYIPKHPPAQRWNGNGKGSEKWKKKRKKVSQYKNPSARRPPPPIQPSLSGFTMWQSGTEPKTKWVIKWEFL